MPEPPRLSPRIVQGSEVSLTGAALVDLLSAVQEKGADFRFRATGMSMYPTIRDGNIITISPLCGLHPAYGDIIAFRHPATGKLVVHRIISVSAASFEAKGDNSDTTDGQFPTSSILGLVTRLERDGGALFWPDNRRSPFFGRMYFTVRYAFVRTRRGFMRFARRIV